MTDDKRETNPFATRYVRPGALPYLFARNASAPTLVAQIERLNWWGQIIGPHGSGKSTLFESLVEPLRAAGRHLVRFSLHDGQRSLPPPEAQPSPWNATSLVMVDGYEQLSWLSRSRLKWNCRRFQAGLLVTAHVDVGLPLLWQTSVDEELAWKVVSHLVAGHAVSGRPPLISRSDVAAACHRRNGDLREVLFDLYDLHEQRRG